MFSSTAAKTQISDLAILGGTPVFTEKIHVGKPNVPDRELLLERVNDILDRQWFTNDGPYVQELEAKLAAFLGVKHCIAMCNGTIALEIAIRATELTGEVIVPSFTFIATAHALQWQGITPVFCDVAPGTHHLDPKRVEELITPRTTGILGVHLWGQACEIEALEEIAQRRNLTLLFDAAHAFACSHNGQMIGSFGRAEVFSFHATKFFNTFEGGAITTNDGDLARKMRFMRNFGFAGYDDVQYVGTNGKMNEISAAMGLTMLDSLGAIIQRNQENYHIYQEQLSGLPGMRFIEHDEDEQRNYQYIVIEIDEGVAGINRDALVKILHAENVIARRYFYPGCHQMEPYRSYFPHAGLLLPNTNKLVTQVMALPTGVSVQPEEVVKICDMIRFVLAHAVEIKQRVYVE
ncbi:MAG: aminotransferase class I/II-fold pyridoxal phosphate-dependent enzyme [Anaerolineaceae bacterium]|nr:aminotransferase class I/II-fold pyridoxal phosphate-dependent enzyme [Anaerolineaceae bacterium]